MTSGKVVLAYVHPAEQVAAVFHHSVVQLLLHDMTHQGRILGGGGHFPVVSGANIVNARNLVVRTFLDAHNAEWLLFVDADHQFPPDLADRLVEAADPKTAPIVGGLYYGIWHGSGSPVQFPQIYYWADDPPGVLRAEFVPDDQLIQVGATGTGCLLIHRSVLEAMRGKHPEPWPWFQETAINGQPVGEDITFCMRAGALGFPIHVHTGIEAGHQKPQILTTATYLQGRSWDSKTSSPSAKPSSSEPGKPNANGAKPVPPRRSNPNSRKARR